MSKFKSALDGIDNETKEDKISDCLKGMLKHLEELNRIADKMLLMQLMNMTERKEEKYIITSTMN